MEKFATNVAGNIESGTEVLSNNMVFLQDAKANSISNIYGDLFVEGILNINMGTNSSPVEPFVLSQGTTAGTFSIGVGIAYKKDVNSGLYERISITDLVDYSNISMDEESSTYPYGTGPSQKTDIGNGTLVSTPKSSGCLNVPIPTSGQLYYIDLRYLGVCDNGNNGNGLNLKNYSIAKNVSSIDTQAKKRFYKWIDGYNVVLIDNLSQQQGIILGTVQKDINNNVTITTNNRTEFALIKSELFLDYLASGGGIVINEIDNKAQLSVDVDNTTTEIEDNKVRVTKDALYPYTKFAINSGPTNFLATSETALALALGPSVELWLNPAYNDRYVVTANMNITSINVKTDLENTGISIEGVPSRIFTVCINNTDKMNNNVSLSTPKIEMMREIIVSSTTPSIYNVGDIWFNTNSQPYQVKWYKSVADGWVDYHGVPVGLVFLNNLGGLVTQATAVTFGANRDYSKFHEVGFLKPYIGVEYDSNSTLQPMLPDKYIKLDGSYISSLYYNDLYRKFGSYLNTQTSTDGGQEGLISFQIPDMTNKTFWGGNIIQYVNSGLPNIKGTILSPNSSSYYGNVSTIRAYYTGAFYMNKDVGGENSALRWTRSDNDTHSWSIDFDAHNSNSIYSDDNNIVQPPVLQTPILIKYSI